MKQYFYVIGATLTLSTSSHALDLQRDQLLDLYHGVKSEEHNTSREWANLSTGIAATYQGNEQEQIVFAPLPEAQTKIGVFTSDTLNDAVTSKLGYEFDGPTQFGQAQDESYGIYIQKSF